MILWTVADCEEIMYNMLESYSVRLQKVEYQGIQLLVEPLENGLARVERILSMRPKDFLRSDLSPGMHIPLHSCTI